MNNINALTKDNCAFVFIDHQPFVAFPVQSIAPDMLTNNVAGLAKVAKALEIPVVLTTISAKGGPLADPLFQQLSSVFPELEPIDRNNTNAFATPEFEQAIAETGRKTLVMCGLWTEVCLSQTVLTALEKGYNVYFVPDCSGGVSPEAHEDAKRLMLQAGARPLNWQAVMATCCPDNTAPEYSRLYEVVVQHGAGVSYAVQYVLANMQQAASHT
ncbi:hydrolase [Hymenobacter saemangeumensis]|uniref:Hydrolase n=1 Tax=Hymenobacter saemangeumensis TaxID=1084522 RepID=A0ABP8I9H1_9BACT